jgi:hypothetical protein
MRTIGAWIESFGLCKNHRKIWVYSKRRLYGLDVAVLNMDPATLASSFFFGHVHNPAQCLSVHLYA